MSQLKKSERNSNLEILRIISMLLIVAYHYTEHGFGTIELSYSVNRYMIGILSLGGKLGVSCFILISGYFMVRSQITVYKLIRVIGEVWFYSVGIGLLFLTVLTPETTLDIKAIIKMCLPVGYYQYWFMTDYIILMIMSPLLNLVISNINKITYQRVIMVSMILWSILPFFIGTGYGYNELLWFVVLYFMAGYIRMYVDVDKKNGSRHFIAAIILCICVILSNIVLIYMGHLWQQDIFTEQSGRLAALYSPFTLFISVELLIGFIKMKPYSNMFVNVVASASLGVYLLSDNEMMRPYLWHSILKVSNMYQSKWLIIHALLSIIGVYVVCTLVDLIRQCTVEKVFLTILNKHLEKLQKIVMDIVMKTMTKGKILLDKFYD